MTIFSERAGLLQRFRDGERDALETVYWAYVDRVAGIVRYGIGASLGRSGRIAGRRQDVSDLVQETFLHAFTPSARKSFDGVRNYGPYLFALTRNVLVDGARRHGREVPTEWPEIEQLMHNDPSESEASTLDPGHREVVESYLTQLTAELRAVHHVRYERGLSQLEGATALGISRQSLRTLEKKLRTGLKRALRRRQHANRSPRPLTGLPGPADSCY